MNHLVLLNFGQAQSSQRGYKTKMQPTQQTNTSLLDYANIQDLKESLV